MFMTPENALYLAKQHTQDLLREAEQDRLIRAAQQGSPHLAAWLIARARATLERITQGEHLPAPKGGIPVEPVTDLHPVM
jgi:hypothetical protein